MVTIICEAHFWTLKDNIAIDDTNFGVFRYHDYKEEVCDKPYAEGKKSYSEARGMLWLPSNKRPNRIKDQLKEFEEHLSHTKIVLCKWRNESLLQIIFQNGLLVNFFINISSGDIEKIVFDKYLIGKLISDHIVDAVFDDSHILCSYHDSRISCLYFTKLPCGNNKDVAYSKLVSLEPKLQVLDLSGPTRRKLERKLSVNVNGDMVLIWWKCSGDEVYPWSPLVKDQDRANVLVYGMNSCNLDLLCYYRTEFDPVCVTFSKAQTSVINTVEQRVSRRGEVTVDNRKYEISTTSLQRTSVTSMPLQTQVCCYGFHPKEDKLLLGCIDSSLVLYDESRDVTQTAKAGFIPSMIAWHCNGAIAMITNERGQLQCFDLALNIVKLQLIAEDPNPCRILDMSSYFKTQEVLQTMSWSCKSRKSSKDYIAPDDYFILLFEKGPLLNLRFNIGVFNGGQLDPYDLISQYMKSKQILEALKILHTLNWDKQGEECIASLMLIMNQLLRLPLDAERIGHMEVTLASYSFPLKPIGEDSIAEYGSQVKDLTIRFFRHLVRHQQFEKAFQLATTLEDPFLLMDIHFHAMRYGENTLASAAKHKADECDGSQSSSSTGSDSCSDTMSGSSVSSCDCSGSCTLFSSTSSGSGDITNHGRQDKQKKWPEKKPAHCKPKPPPIPPRNCTTQSWVDMDHVPLLAGIDNMAITVDEVTSEDGWEEEEDGRVKVIHFGVV